MPVLAPLAAFFWMAAGPVDVNASVAAEARAGETPIIFNEAPRAAVAGVVTPGLSLDLLDRHNSLHLDYNLRLYSQRPNINQNESLLVLHIANLRAAAQPSETLTLTATAELQTGKADYAYLPQVLGTNQATLPTDIPGLLSLVGTADARLQVTRRWLAELRADGTYREPRGYLPPQTVVGTTLATSTPAFAFPRQKYVQVTPSVAEMVTRLDDITISSPFGYQATASDVIFHDSQTGVDQPDTVKLSLIYVAPRVQWHTRPTRRLDLRFTGGVAWSHLLHNDFGLGNFQNWTGVGGTEFALRLVQRHDLGVSLRGSATVDYFVDPVLRTAGPRGVATGGIGAVLPPDWMMGVDMSFGTALQKPDPILNDPDVTSASVVAWARRRLSDGAFSEFGVRWSDRGPYFGSDRASTSFLGFHQRQLWLYVGISATTLRLPRWSP